jgi:hypothetical protein
MEARIIVPLRELLFFFFGFVEDGGGGYGVVVVEAQEANTLCRAASFT